MVAQGKRTGDPLINEIRDLRAKVENLARKTTYPFSIAPDEHTLFSITPDPEATAPNGKPVANLTVGYGDGAPLMRSRPGASGRQVFEVLDRNSSALFQTDDLSGYGLAWPQIPCPMYPWVPGITNITGSVFSAVLGGQMKQVNPAFLVEGSIRILPSGTAAAEMFIRLYDPANNWTYDFPVLQTGGRTVDTWMSYGPAACMVPADAIGNTLEVTVNVRMSAGSGSAGGTVRHCGGTDTATYNRVNGIGG